MLFWSECTIWSDQFVWILSGPWLIARQIFFFFSLLCISRTHIRMSCSSCALAVDIQCCCCCCCSLCCLCCCCYLICIKWFISYNFPDSMPKSVAIADTKETGTFIETPHVTRVVFPLTGIDGSLHIWHITRFHSFIHKESLSGLLTKAVL